MPAIAWPCISCVCPGGPLTTRTCPLLVGRGPQQINSLVRQTEHIYALNARAEYPFHLHATSFGGQYRERMDRCCSWSEWRRAGGVNFMQGSLTEELPSLVARILAGPGASSAKTAEQGAPDQDMDQSAGQTTEQAGEQAGEQIAKVSPSQTPSHTPGQTPSHTSNHGLALHMDAETGRPTEEVDPAQWQSRVIYLTAESPNVVEKIAPGHIYVIGNLVDNNHHPGLCYERARQAGVRTARLPISEHIRLDTRHVLTINQGTRPRATPLSDALPRICPGHPLTSPLPPSLPPSPLPVPSPAHSPPHPAGGLPEGWRLAGRPGGGHSHAQGRDQARPGPQAAQGQEGEAGPRRAGGGEACPRREACPCRGDHPGRGDCSR